MSYKVPAVQEPWYMIPKVNTNGLHENCKGCQHIRKDKGVGYCPYWMDPKLIKRWPCFFRTHIQNPTISVVKYGEVKRNKRGRPKSIANQAMS